MCGARCATTPLVDALGHEKEFTYDDILGAAAEGDGGVIYNGMDLSGGYGMQYLHNFIELYLESDNPIEIDIEQAE